MEYRRGFKAEANAYPREMRQELGLSPIDPLCPWTLAPNLGFEIIKLIDYSEHIPDEVVYLRSVAGRKQFSAVTITRDGVAIIIHNDTHDPKRQAANIAHELAHGILIHKPQPVFDAFGSRHFDPEQEKEATWLGPALLVSEEAALHIVEQGLSIGEASDRYGASEDVVRMRLNVTAAYRRARRVVRIPPLASRTVARP